MPHDKPHQIFCLMELEDVAKAKGAVYAPDSRAWRKPKPAAVVLRLQGDIILGLLRKGLFVYNKDSGQDAQQKR